MNVSKIIAMCVICHSSHSCVCVLSDACPLARRQWGSADQLTGLCPLLSLWASDSTTMFLSTKRPPKFPIS